MPQLSSQSECAAFAHLLPLLDDDDGEMTPALAAARAHVRECARCQHALMDYQYIDVAVRHYYAAVVPAPLQSEAIMDFIAENTPDPALITALPPKPIRRRWPQAINAAIITALVIILVVGFTITRWHSQLFASPPPTPSNMVLDSISMISPNEGWAVADTWNANWDLNLPSTWKSSTMYHYQHAEWSPETLSAPAVIAVHLLHLHMLSHTEGWALGNAVIKPGTSRQLVMHYNGVIWSPVADAGQTTLDYFSGFDRYTTLQSISANSIWVGSFELSTSVEETKLPAIGHIVDGHTWKIEYLPLPYQGVNINLTVTSLAMVNDDEGWLAAQISLPSAATGPTAGETVLYHRTHGNWVIATILHDDTAYFTQMAMTSPSDGWVLGQQANQTTNRPIPLFYHYTQSKWTPFAAGITAASGDDTLLSMLSAQDGWVLINGSQLQAYHFDGKRWSLQQQIGTANLGYVTLMEASFPSSTEGWVVGYRAIYTGKNTQYYYPLFLHYTQGKWSVYP